VINPPNAWIETDTDAAHPKRLDATFNSENCKPDIDSRRLFIVTWRFWRILVILGLGACGVYLFKTGALTKNLTSATAGILSYLGLALNLVVFILNNGFMPVRTKTIPPDYQTTHKPIDDRTRAWFLGDSIRVARCYVSLGDLCMAAGVAVYFAGQVLGVIRDTR